MDRLHAAGAAEVVPEALESSLMLASHALLLTGIPLSRVVKRVRTVREGRYGSLRGFFHGADDAPEDLTESDRVRLHSVPIPAGAFAVNRALGTLHLVALRVEIVTIRRAGKGPAVVSDDVTIGVGDVVVLKGSPEALAQAEAKLLAG